MNLKKNASFLTNSLQNYKIFFIYANFFVTLQPKIAILGYYGIRR